MRNGLMPTPSNPLSPTRVTRYTMISAKSLRSRMKGNFQVRFCKGVWDGDIPFDPTQLRIFLEYKGIKEGVKVVTIPPAYTSQTCHCCLHIGLRTNKQFKCVNKSCGWLGDADFNGAKMIELWGCSVSQPRGSELLSCAIEPGLLKAPSELNCRRQDNQAG